jgi:outer membrane protein assembly factor BamD (BamD/ComL family)
MTCSSVETNLSVDETYQKLKNSLEKGNLRTSEEYLETLKNKDEDSKYFQDYLWLQGDLFFKKKEYAEAIYNYQLFLDLYPYNSEFENISWKIVLAYNKLIAHDSSRDISYCPTLNRFASKFVGIKPEAQVMIDKCHNFMAKKEYNLSKEYYRMNKKESSLNRLKYFFVLFKGVHIQPQVWDNALIFSLQSFGKKCEQFIQYEPLEKNSKYHILKERCLKNMNNY